MGLDFRIHKTVFKFLTSGRFGEYTVCIFRQEAAGQKKVTIVATAVRPSNPAFKIMFSFRFRAASRMGLQTVN
jgi:hypothetical protein